VHIKTDSAPVKRVNGLLLPTKDKTHRIVDSIAYEALHYRLQSLDQTLYFPFNAGFITLDEAVISDSSRQSDALNIQRFWG